MRDVKTYRTLSCWPHLHSFIWTMRDVKKNYESNNESNDEEFYLNYEGCKVQGSNILCEWWYGFIWTMRDVKYMTGSNLVWLALCFIWTMRDVKEGYRHGIVRFRFSFIWTMRDVKINSTQSTTLENARFIWTMRDVKSKIEKAWHELEIVLSELWGM